MKVLSVNMRYLGKYKLLFFLLLTSVLLWFFFTYKITDVPPGINGDESPIGYNAILLSRTLHDENNRFLPLFVSTQDGVDWKQPVTMYATTIAFRLFGPSFEMLRGVSAAIIIISAILLFIFLKESFNIKTAIAGLAIFVTTPVVMIQSHLALENIAPMPFILLWLLMLLRYEKTQRLKFALLAGVMLGMSVYAYQAMRIIAPIFAIISVIYIFTFYLNGKKEGLRACLYFAFGILPFFLFLFWVKTEYPGALTAYNQAFKIASYQEFLLPYLSSFDLSFLFIKGDSTLYHSTGKHGVYLLATLPLFLMGCYHSIRSKKALLVLILAAFIFAPALFGLVGSIHRGSRLMAMLPSYVIITTVGFKFLLSLELQIKKIKTAVISIVIILVAINYFDFLNDYWFAYPERARLVFPSSAHTAFKGLYEQSVPAGKTPVIRRDIYNRERMGSEFFSEMYFPKTLKKWEIGESLDDNSVVLVHTVDLPTMEKIGYKKIAIEIPNYSLVSKSK